MTELECLSICQFKLEQEFECAGRAKAFAVLASCCGADAEGLLLGCAAALEPGNNCPLDMRIQCLKGRPPWQSTHTRWSIFSSNLTLCTSHRTDVHSRREGFALLAL